MNRLSLFALVLFSFFALVTQAQKPGLTFPEGVAGTDYNRLNAKGKKEGAWIRVYQSSPKVLYYKGQFSAGVPTGIFEFYYETGDLRSKVNHVKDTTINDVTNYHPDGVTILSEGRYVGKVIDKKFVRQKQGVWKLYDATGVLRAEENYLDDKLDGICKYMFENGKLISSSQYVAGVKNGPFTEYFDSGKKMREGFYEKDDYAGAFTSYNANGTVESQGKFEFGLREGQWRYNDTSGKPLVTILYKKGTEVKRQQENGTVNEYYESGIPKAEYNYADGKLDGPFQEWYDKGQFVQVPGTKEDLEVGIAYREKLDGTQLKREGDYMNGMLEGDIIYYKENGTIEKVETYTDGKLVNTKKSN